MRSVLQCLKSFSYLSQLQSASVAVDKPHDTCSFNRCKFTLTDGCENATTSEVIDHIGGWARSGVGEGYGDGYSLSKMYDYLDRITLIISTPDKP